MQLPNYFITYAEYTGGIKHKYGPVPARDAFAAMDALRAAYAKAGLTTPGHIYQISTDWEEGN
jgi:hypothetical protein